MTLVDIALGFVIGLVAATIAFELGIKKFLPRPYNADWTTKWDLADVGPRPSVVAERITGVDLPKNARVIVRSAERSLDDGPRPEGVQVKVHPGVRGNYVVGASRALVFNSVIHPGAAVVHTVDDRIVDKLNREFDRLWYADERPGDDVAADTVVDDEVSARGVVVGVEKAEDGAWMAKLSSQGKLLPVALAQGEGLEGQVVRVTGNVVYRDGQRVLKARSVERTGNGPGR